MLKRITLDNGLRIVCEKIPYLRSVSMGIWVGTGSRNEDSTNNGISHFIEHMMFKGTASKSAKEIAESIDNIGGQINAFTGKECTCYYTKTLDTHLDISMDVLTDMVFNSKFSEKDIDTERKVILEEIGMYEDSPEELVHDILSESVWSGNPLGYPILGTQKSLSEIDRDMIVSYVSDYYTPCNSVVSIAGNYNDDDLDKLIHQYLSRWPSNKNLKPVYGSTGFITGETIKEKDTEQVHICLGFEGIEHGNDQLYTLLAINNIFGGGMSSRLFQKVREEKGLVYSIYSYPSSYKNAGLFTIYAGMNPEHIDKVINIIAEEVRLLKNKGITKEDLQKSKEQLKGNYILGLESTSSRMNSNGKSELLLEYINSPEEILDKVDKIDMDSVNKVIEEIFDIDKASFSAVGSIKSDYNYKLAFA